MINGPWTMQRAQAFARRIGQDSSLTLDHRIAFAYALAFGRPPTSEETTAGVKFLQTNAAQSTDALTDFCHALLNSNEFLYVD